MRHDYCAYERMILRRKTIFLGPLKFFKNMLSKLILIGLFVLKNNRTIREPNSLQGGGGRKGNCSHVLFSGGYGLHGKLKVGFRMGGYGRHGSQWVNVFY